MRHFRASLLGLLALVVVLGGFANAARASYTATAVYSFLGYPDGDGPYGNLIMDASGNLYGTTRNGGAFGGGSVFELMPGSGSWTEIQLYSFTGGADGSQPYGGLVFDSAGNLYGTTFIGGNLNVCGGSGCGVVFELEAANGWAESVIYTFSGATDGAYPTASLIVDSKGNLYGTASSGGNAGCVGVLPNGCGVVFKLIPQSGQWRERVLHTFNGGKDGDYPTAGLVADSHGNLYGTTAEGGTSFKGVVYELLAGSGAFQYKILHTFSGGRDGGNFSVAPPLILDSAGNLYGTTQIGGNLDDCGGTGCGTVFELSVNSNGKWFEQVLHAFTAQSPDGSSPEAGLTIDAAGNLYGTTLEQGSYGIGNIFEEMRISTGFKEQILYQFTDPNLGCNPNTTLVLDAAGNLYGTTSFCGANDYGVVYKLMP